MFKKVTLLTVMGLVLLLVAPVKSVTFTYQPG